MKILFFAVPYRGHLQPNLPLLRSLLERGHFVTILGGGDFLRKNLEESLRNKKSEKKGDREGVLQCRDLPEYLMRAYQSQFQEKAEGNSSAGSAAVEFYSYLCQEEQILRQEAFVRELQERFWAECGPWVREEKADWIFYDTYAFYCSRITEEFWERSVQINSAVWEAGKCFQSDSWRSYLEEIVLPELAAASSESRLPKQWKLPAVDQLLRGARRRFRRREREEGSRRPCAFGLAYHSPSLQNEPKLLDDRYGYLGFPGGADLYPTEKGHRIYLSRGTMAGAYDRQLLCRTLEGLKDTGWEIDVSAGGQAGIAEELAALVSGFSGAEAADSLVGADQPAASGQPVTLEGGRIRVHVFCDQAALLRRAGAFVCHGGISGVREAIFCETPILVIPSNYQDYQVGKALERAGAGKMLTDRPLTVSAIRERWKNFCQDYEEMREGIRELKWEMRSWWDTKGILPLYQQLGL